MIFCTSDVCIVISFIAAATAKLRQSCPTLCNPIDSSPPGSSVHGILRARILEWVAISIPTIQLWGNSLCESGLPSPWFNSWVRKIPWRRDRLPTPVFLSFSCGSAGKESACKEEDLGSIPGLGRPPGERKGYPLQYSSLENSMDQSPWGHKESDMTERLALSLCMSHSNFTFLSLNFLI